MNTTPTSKEAQTTARGAVPPAPGFPTLVRIHLESLCREFPVAWIVFGGFAAALPLASLIFRDTLLADPGTTGTVATFSGLLSLLLTLTIAIAFLWPDGVWRNLPPGGRQALDALPVSRRAHRMARVTAGLALPLVMAFSVAATLAVLQGSPAFASGLWPSGTMEGGLVAGAAGGFSLTAAYLLSSAIAIRFGRVLLSLVILVAGSAAVVYLALLAGWNAGAGALQTALFLGHWAPGRALTLAAMAESSDLAPAFLWSGVLLGICVHWAARHDRP
jgi:hypothetical protein